MFMRCDCKLFSKKEPSNFYDFAGSIKIVLYLFQNKTISISIYRIFFGLVNSFFSIKKQRRYILKKRTIRMCLLFLSIKKVSLQQSRTNSE